MKGNELTLVNPVFRTTLAGVGDGACVWGVGVVWVGLRRCAGGSPRCGPRKSRTARAKRSSFAPLGRCEHGRFQGLKPLATSAGPSGAGADVEGELLRGLREQDAPRHISPPRRARGRRDAPLRTRAQARARRNTVAQHGPRGAVPQQRPRRASPPRRGLALSGGAWRRGSGGEAEADAVGGFFDVERGGVEGAGEVWVYDEDGVIAIGE